MNRTTGKVSGVARGLFCWYSSGHARHPGQLINHSLIHRRKYRQSAEDAEMKMLKIAWLNLGEEMKCYRKEAGISEAKMIPLRNFG
jgi:hypothetical protein